MDIYSYLSNKNNFEELIRVSVYEVFKRTNCCKEDAEDMVFESIGNLLDYYQRKPEKLIELELKSYEEMQNYFKKAIRNQIINIIVKNHKKNVKEKIIINTLITNNRNLLQTSRRFLQQIFHPYSNIDDCAKEFLNKRELNYEYVLRDIYLFIEYKYKKDKWINKKEIIKLFIQRIEQNKTISQMQRLMPDKNLISLNTQAHRIFCSYREWRKNKK